MKNYRNAETKEEMLANIEEITELLGRVPEKRYTHFLKKDLAKYPASSRISEYKEIIDSWVRSYAMKLYQDEGIGMAAAEERVYSEMGVATRRASYNDAILEVIE